ncbi:MAG: DUF2167 domain-containing protein [Polyangia bacterium]
MKKLLALSAISIVGCLAVGLSSSLAHADVPAAAPPKSELKMHDGPEKIALGHKITLDLPEPFVFIDAANAKPLLAKGGNFMGDNFLGMVFPKAEGPAGWWLSVEYEDEGYVKDDETLDAKKLLASMQEGTKEGNEARKEKGFGPMFIDRWTEEPRYDKATHHLVWALELHVEQDGKSHSSSNYETRILGRKGFVSLTLITSPEHLAQYKPVVESLLSATTFDGGARYGDFDSKTDKVATYGLLGLIGGGAGIAALKVAKLGLLAKFGKVILLGLAKFGKAIALAFVAFFGFLRNGIKKLFGGKPTPERAPPPSMVNQSGNAPAVDRRAERDDGNGEGGPPGTD